MTYRARCEGRRRRRHRAPVWPPEALRGNWVAPRSPKPFTMGDLQATMRVLGDGLPGIAEFDWKLDPDPFTFRPTLLLRPPPVSQMIRVTMPDEDSGLDPDPHEAPDAPTEDDP